MSGPGAALVVGVALWILIGVRFAHVLYWGDENGMFTVSQRLKQVLCVIVWPFWLAAALFKVLFLE